MNIDDDKEKNPLHFRVDPNSKHEFGKEYIPIIPSEDEVRYIGAKSVECRYYLYSLDVEKSKANTQSLTSYESCKDIINNLYECFTDSKYGTSINEVPADALGYVHAFSDCMRMKDNLYRHCSSQFTDIIRAMYRSKDSKLK